MTKAKATTPLDRRRRKPVHATPLPPGAHPDDKVTVPEDPVDTAQAKVLGREPGRPSKFKPEFVEIVERMCMLGLSNRELSHVLGISEETFKQWLESYEQIRTAVFNGRDGADAMVSRALFMRAIGYKHDDEEIKVVSVGGNAGSEVQRVPTVKHYPPDVGAITMWLANRQREKWKSPNGASLVVNPGATPQELAAVARAAMAAAMAEVGNPATTPDQPTGE